MATLAEIRAKLQQEQSQKERRAGGGGDNATFKFWDLPDDGQATIRFLPDGDQNNTFFWREKTVFRIPFVGIKNETDRETFVTVPCMQMFGKKDKILQEISPWWNDPDLQAEARKYYRKKNYMFHGFVTQIPGGFNDPKPENPIRRFLINAELFDIIKSALLDPEMEESPTHFEQGRDFVLKKTKKGKWAAWNTSKWSMKERALNEEELMAIEKYEIEDLSKYLPKEPTAEEQDVIFEMFQDSVNSMPWDPAKYSKFYKPSGYGYDNAGSDSEKSATPAARTPVVETEAETADEETVVDSTPAAPKSSAAAEILAKLKKDKEDVVETKAEAPKVEAAAPTAKMDPKEILARIRAKQAG